MLLGVIKLHTIALNVLTNRFKELVGPILAMLAQIRPFRTTIVINVLERVGLRTMWSSFKVPISGLRKLSRGRYLSITWEPSSTNTITIENISSGSVTIINRTMSSVKNVSRAGMILNLMEYFNLKPTLWRISENLFLFMAHCQLGCNDNTVPSKI